MQQVQAGLRWLFTLVCVDSSWHGGMDMTYIKCCIVKIDTLQGFCFLFLAKRKEWHLIKKKKISFQSFRFTVKVVVRLIEILSHYQSITCLIVDSSNDLLDDSIKSRINYRACDNWYEREIRVSSFIFVLSVDILVILG